MDSTILCPKCGVKQDWGARFCVECGTPLGTVADASAVAPADTSGTVPRSPSYPPTAWPAQPPVSSDGMADGIVVEVEANRPYFANHASQLRFRTIGSLDGPCHITLCMVLSGLGRFVDQEPDERVQSCRIERRGDQRVFSFPFRGLTPGEIPLRQFRMLVTRPDRSAQWALADLPDQSLFVRISDPHRPAQTDGIHIAGGIHIDLSHLEAYGTDIRNLFSLSTGREAEAKADPTVWQPIMVCRPRFEPGAGPLPATAAFCRLPSCGRHVLPAESFCCQRCRKPHCRQHEDQQRAGCCPDCAEALRADEFTMQVARLDRPGGGADVMTMLSGVSAPSAPFRGRIWLERGTRRITRDIAVVPKDSKDVFAVGEPFSLNVETDRDCYLTLLDIGTSGAITLLAQDYRLRAGRPVSLSGPNDEYVWQIGGPPGIERLKAFFALQPLTLFPEVGDFGSLGGCGATRETTTRLHTALTKLQRMPPGVWTDAGCQFVVQEI